VEKAGKVLRVLPRQRSEPFVALAAGDIEPAILRQHDRPVKRLGDCRPDRIPPTLTFSYSPRAGRRMSVILGPSGTKISRVT